MSVRTVITSAMALAGTTALIIGCSGSGGGGGPSTSNPLANLGSEITSHMSSSIPSASSLASVGMLSPKAVAGWASANADLKKPGCTQTGQSLKQFALDLLDSDYECVDGNGSYTPSVFGRFSMTMLVLKVIGSNIAFENGAPKVGAHEFTEDVPVEGGTFPVSFDVNVTAVTSDHFDVKITVVGTAGGQTLISGNTIYFKNRNNKTNIMALQDNGSDRISWDVLYWNRSSGAMSYTYASRVDGDDASEVQKIVIEGTGAHTRVGHYMVNAGDHVFFTADFPNAADSTEATVAFEQTGSHAIDSTVYCVDVEDLSEKAAASLRQCSGYQRLEIRCRYQREKLCPDKGSFWCQRSGMAG